MEMKEGMENPDFATFYIIHIDKKRAHSRSAFFGAAFLVEEKVREDEIKFLRVSETPQLQNSPTPKLQDSPTPKLQDSPTPKLKTPCLSRTVLSVVVRRLFVVVREF
ncbi:hypothetical protein LS482_08645 [Sinomicrobium kalidii]|uniref:hypothetical protein n=1 Tax=Sinomicrobium kalidii TaxID=2900738 RepID=UPI001E60135B|nr:hypothetical protein [Sinomicrobium kalidii]UGU17935.1 hypothetical protein LS482_08645 [Sinomicrobium kalidii]